MHRSNYEDAGLEARGPARGFDDADTLAASSGFTPHCSFGFSHNDEGKGAGKLLGVEVTAPTRIVGVFIRLSNDKDGLKFADRLRVDPKDMA